MRYKLTLALTAAALLIACGYSSLTNGTSAVSTGGGGGGGGGTPSANVTIADFTFSPETVTVSVGQTVQWTNVGPSVHTTTSDGGTWNSGSLNAVVGTDSTGATFQQTFTQAGTYPYHCSIHPPSLYPGFTGVVVVTP